MRFKSALLGATLVLTGAILSSGANAVVIPVSNASFEILPEGGLTAGMCGAGCSWSNGPIPDWNIAVSGGQFQPGVSSGTLTYFNSVPDGLTVAYTNDGAISQTVSTTAVAGVTYVLQVDVGFRKDFQDPGTVLLGINGNFVPATGTALQLSGDWSTYTASYTATAADAGKPITISLDSPNIQGDWDNVRLSAVPELSTWMMLLLGFAGVGFAGYRRKAGASFRLA